MVKLLQSSDEIGHPLEEVTLPQLREEAISALAYLKEVLEALATRTDGEEALAWDEALTDVTSADVRVDLAHEIARAESGAHLTPPCKPTVSVTLGNGRISVGVR